MKNKLLLKTLYLSIAVFAFALLFNSCKTGNGGEEEEMRVRARGLRGAVKELENAGWWNGLVCLMMKSIK